MNRFVGVSLLFLLLLPSWAAAQNFADYLPEKTLAYVSIESVVRSVERGKKSAFHAVWNDPAMEAMRDLIDRMMDKASEEGDRPDVKVAEFAELLQGQVCFALIPVGQNDSAEVVLIDCKGDRPAILDLLKRSRTRKDVETRESEEEFSGYTITTIHELIEGQEEPDTSYRFLKDEFLGYGENLDVLKDIIARKATGEKTGLSASTAYQQVLAGTGDRADVRFFVSASLWLREFGMAAAAVLGPLGMDGVRGVGGQMTLHDNGLGLRLLVQNTAKPRGVMKLLGGNLDNLGPPASLPGDIEQSTSFALDWQFLYKESMRILGGFQPQMKQQIEASVAMAEQQLGVRLHEDLLAALAPGLTYTSMPVPEADKAKAPKDPQAYAAFLLKYAVGFQQLRDKESMVNILDKLSKAEGAPFKQTEFLGTTIYDGDEMGLPSLAVIGDQLVFASTDSLRALARRQGKEIKGFRDSAAYKRALELVPSKRSFFSISNPDAMAGGSMVMQGIRMNAGQRGGKELLDALPSDDFLAKCLDVSVVALSTEEHGLLMTGFWGVKAPDAESDEE